VNSASGPDQAKRAVKWIALAQERTEMAWHRTAVSQLTCGFSVFKFFEPLEGKTCLLV
jgi:uncharacterized membrane protein YidH (DUF202 family)